MEIKRSGAQPSGKGPADWFTGTVRIDSLFQSPDPARAAGASVTFEPALARLGTLIRLDRRSLSRQVSGGHSVGAVRLKKSGRVM